MAILKKLKKGLKKAAKVAIPVGAALLAARAMKRRGEMKDFLATEGGNKSDMRSYGPFSKAANFINKPSKYVRSKTVLGKPGINRMDTSEVDLDYTAPSTAQYRNMDMGLQGYYKKGGRVGCGVAKKGFGKAMKKGKR
jgi:hypothetical protein